MKKEMERRPTTSGRKESRRARRSSSRGVSREVEATRTSTPGHSLRSTAPMRRSATGGMCTAGPTREPIQRRWLSTSRRRTRRAPRNRAAGAAASRRFSGEGDTGVQVAAERMPLASLLHFRDEGAHRRQDLHLPAVVDLPLEEPQRLVAVLRRLEEEGELLHQAVVEADEIGT